VAYNRIGKHLNRSRATTVSSEAALPILLNMALKARQSGSLPPTDIDSKLMTVGSCGFAIE